MRLRGPRVAVVEDEVRPSARLAAYGATIVPRCAQSSGLAGLRAARASNTHEDTPLANVVKLAPVARAPRTARPARSHANTHEPSRSEPRGIRRTVDLTLVERRLEDRDAVVLPVVAARCDGIATTWLGETVDVSSSGLQIVMDSAAEGDDLDILVGAASGIVLRGKVIDQHRDERGHVWHVFLLEVDDYWHTVVDRHS